MSVRWHSYPDPGAAAAACARQIIALLDDALSGQPVATLAVSGGTTPKLLFQELVNLRYNWDRVHLFFVDERAVPPTDPQSNYKLAEEFLIAPAHIGRHNVHRVRGEITPVHAAEHFAKWRGRTGGTADTKTNQMKFSFFGWVEIFIFIAGGGSHRTARCVDGFFHR